MYDSLGRFGRLSRARHLTLSLSLVNTSLYLSARHRQRAPSDSFARATSDYGHMPNDYNQIYGSIYRTRRLLIPENVWSFNYISLARHLSVSTHNNRQHSVHSVEPLSGRWTASNTRVPSGARSNTLRFIVSL
jgi:hypothetical protein